MLSIAAVSFYEVVVFVHITAVLIAFGPTFAYGVFYATALRDGGGAVPTIARAVLSWDRNVGTFAMTLILLTGIYLGADGPYGMGSFFISWGFVAIIIFFALSHGFFIPRTKRSLAIAERDLRDSGELSDELARVSMPLSRVGALAGLLVVLTIYVMTAKPFL